MLACTNFLWWLNSETLTQLKGQTLPGSQIFLFFKKKLVLTSDSHTSENR
jgi:hypothetical protein